MTNAPQEGMVGKYRIIERLGAGSQGTVYRAQDTTLGREVALKVLHPMADPAVVARFEREARIVASISHPNIAHVFDIGEHGGLRFIAMEYVPNAHEASELIGRAPMDVVHAASMARQTALALEAARVKGITHHDVKPDNLILTSLDAGGMVKLIDFGIAHAQGMASMTRAGAQWGTPFYMPPEQWAGERGDTRSDVYSLGVIMYQMLAGHVPFDSAAENNLVKQAEIARQHGERAAPPLRSIRGDVPEELDALIAKCMAKSPSERWRTPGELASALEGMFGFAAPEASLAPSSAPAQARPSPPRRARRPSSPRPQRAPRPSRPAGQAPPIFAGLPPVLRNRSLLAAGAIGALVALMALIIMASQSGDDEPPPRIMVVAPPTHTPTPAATPRPAATAPRSEAPTPAPTPTWIPNPTMPPPPGNPDALADLRVAMDSFGWSPSRPSVGDAVTFSIEIRNNGSRDAGPSLLAYSIDGIDGSRFGEVDIPPIPAGDSAEATFAWTAKAGHYNVTFEVDAENRVRERSEGNNTVLQGLIYYGTALSDLSVVSIEWTPENPEQGEEVVIAATAVNKGEGRAPRSKINLYVDDDSVGVKLLPPIPPGGTASVNFKWTAQAGYHKLSAVADDSKTITELNENNNTLSIPYEATVPAVDLYVEGEE